MLRFENHFIDTSLQILPDKNYLVVQYPGLGGGGHALTGWSLRVYGLCCSSTGSLSQKDPRVGLTCCCHYLELNNF